MWIKPQNLVILPCFDRFFHWVQFWIQNITCLIIHLSLQIHKIKIMSPDIGPFPPVHRQRRPPQEHPEKYERGLPPPVSPRGNPRGNGYLYLARWQVSHRPAAKLAWRKNEARKKAWGEEWMEVCRLSSSHPSPWGHEVDCVLNNKHHNWQFAPVAGHSQQAII